MAIILLDSVNLLHGHGVEAHSVLQVSTVVEQRDAHGHDVLVNLVDGLGGGDLLFLTDDLRCDAGGEGAVHLQVEGAFAYDGAMAEAEVALIILADPENDAVGVGEHHVVRQDQVIFRADDVKQALEIDVILKEVQKICRL